MAAHCPLFPPPDTEAMVRGDPSTWVVRFRLDGVDEDITGHTWRCHVRAGVDGSLVSACTSFDVTTPDDLPPEMFPDDPGSTPCVLLVGWSADDTAGWQPGFAADVEQLTPTKWTRVILDSLRVDPDVSHDEAMP